MLGRAQSQKQRYFLALAGQPGSERQFSRDAFNTKSSVTQTLSAGGTGIILKDVERLALSRLGAVNAPDAVATPLSVLRWSVGGRFGRRSRNDCCWWTGRADDLKRTG
jgi:hypothetical protein